MINAVSLAADDPAQIQPDVANQSLQHSGASSKKVQSIALLQTDMLFGFDSWELSVDGVRLLKRQLEQLALFDEILSVLVTGHSDAIGPADYNLILSRRRASAIVQEVRNLYPDINVALVAAGESQPLVDNSTRENRRKNRRVEIEVISIGRREQAVVH